MELPSAGFLTVVMIIVDDDENYDNCPQDCSPPCGLLDSSCTKNSDCVVIIVLMGSWWRN